jgi:catechol 2,3-dioxygenase
MAAMKSGRKRPHLAVEKIGHVVLRVRSLDRSLAFYSRVLGLIEVARKDFGEGEMAFLSTGESHHDIALVETGVDTIEGGTGLHHVGLKIGDSLEDLVRARETLEAHGIVVHAVLDHRVSRGIYVTDPEGHLLELYVDAAESLWRENPSLVATSETLRLPRKARESTTR